MSKFGKELIESLTEAADHAEGKATNVQLAREATMYRVTLECSGVPPHEGDTAAIGIARNFAEHRLHHANVSCTFADGIMTLVAENDFDPKGLALMDEFSDCLSAYIATRFDGDIIVKSTSAI